MKSIELIGNVGKVEEKENSLAVSICVNEQFKNESGEYEERESWVNCVMDKRTKIGVGDLVFVRGGFQIENYLSKEKNEPKSAIRCFVKEYRRILKKKDEEQK